MKKALIFNALLFSSILLNIGCEETLGDTIAVIQTTNNNAQKTFTSLIIDGEVSSDESTPIISHGVCWSTQPNPTINDNYKVEGEESFSSEIADLVVNTTYFFRVYATTETGTVYSEQSEITTLSLADTSWEFITFYSSPNDFQIHSQVDFFGDNTTKFDEMDYPSHCPGCFITYGTWISEGNNLKYIWEGADENSSTYIYEGVVSGMGIEGTYTHSTLPDNTWNAEML